MQKTPKFGYNRQKVGYFRGLMPKWTKSRLFDFSRFFNENRMTIFAKSSETEVGSAGEQPSRDSLMND